ncbi:MAG: hypothetical protein OEZ05_04965 [Nitrospirota bacterium]|nr:hypothetical protein [Nitrospirota bacterium]
MTVIRTVQILRKKAMAPTLQPPTGRIALTGHKPLSHTTIHGWPAILFGGAFALMGSPILAIGMGWMDYSESSIHAPLWVIGVCGGLLVACGVWLIVHGVQGLHRQWNLSHGKQQLPDKPWLWDYDWQASGITDNTLKESLNSLLALGVFIVFLTPFNWIAFVSQSGGIFWPIVTGLLDGLILLGVGSYLLKNVGQFLTFGNGRVKFSDFPFFLGQPMYLTIEGMPEDLTNVQLNLRCIEEAYEIREREGGQKRESIVVCYQIYHEAQTIRGEQVNETGELRCVWNLPNDTNLTSTPSERPATFWELEVQGTRPGIDYHHHFLLPVYTKIQ